VISDPNSSFLGGISQNLNQFTFAPQFASLFGFNLPAVPIISVRDYFLVQMESWFTSIPTSTQWVLVIDNYPKALRTSIIQGLERIDGGKRGFDINPATTLLNSLFYQKIIGCLFASSVTLPSEEYDPESVSVSNNRGYLPGILGGPRTNTPKTLAIDFRETNTSFIDFVIRPWTILASHYGMVARPGDNGQRKDDKNIKCNMQIFQYTRTLRAISMIPRKIWTFYNCVPFNVGEETFDYETDKLDIFTTRWTYSNYTVENNNYLALADIINRIQQGAIPRVTTFQNGIGSINPIGFI